MRIVIVSYPLSLVMMVLLALAAGGSADEMSRISATAVVVIAAGVTQRRPAGGTPGLLAVVAAILDVIGNVAFMIALQAGLLSLVSVVAVLYPAWTVLLARLVLGERTGRTQQVDLVLAAVAVGLIAGAA